jgi:cephalosporin hydroxylase
MDKSFEQLKMRNIDALGSDERLREASLRWIGDVSRYRYSYHFEWLGRPIIQFPQDIIAMQEIVWTVRPEMIIETGIAHGGSLIFYASMLELIGDNGRVLGIDVDIREPNRIEIEKHPLFKRIDMIQGSSVDTKVVDEVYERARGKRRVLVVLDSLHTHAHVRQELEVYSRLVGKDSYLVVLDTIIEDLPEDFFPDRPWGKGNNPRTAVWDFLKTTDRFIVDKDIQNKLLITVAPDGYLKCIKD